MDRKIETLIHGKKEVIYAEEDETLSIILEKLNKNKIHSVPYREKTHDGSYLISRYIDTLDIVYLLVALIQQRTSSPAVGEILNISSLSELIHSHLTPVQEQFNLLPPCESLYFLSPENKFGDLLKVLGRGLHRVLVVEPNPVTHSLTRGADVKAILTQTWTLQKLAENQFALLGSVSKQTCEQLNFLHSVVSISNDSFAIDAFVIMKSKGVGAIAVVDKEGRFVDNISAADLSSALKQFSFSRTNPSLEFWAAVLLPLPEFLAFVHPTRTPAKISNMVCTKSSTIEEVVSKLLQFHLHQIYLLDDQKKPIGVVSTGDICKVVLASWEQTQNKQ